MYFRKLIFIAIIALTTISSALAGQDDSLDFWQRSKQKIEQVYYSPLDELYIPLNTWHNRHMYDKSKTDKYNEKPWGLGYGRYRYDENGNWHSLYGMIFKDSHNHFEPILGYGYQYMWMPFGEAGFRVGIGFTASITARHDYKYIPIPIALPLISLEYNRLSIQATYIPGTYNNGNVLFTWLRWQL